MFSGKQNVIGYDVSDGSIKVMQMSQNKNGYSVVGYSHLDLPKGIMVNDVIMDEPKMQKYLAQVLQKPEYGHLNTKMVVASLPEAKAFVRVLQIPVMPEAQAAAAVPFEAEQYIPMPLDQVYMDWQILRKSGNDADKGDKMDVLVTAAPKEYVDTFLRVFKNAGLQPVAFEVESAACARALLPLKNPSVMNSSVLILDMGSFRTSLITCENGNLQYTLSVPISGNSLTQALVKTLNIKEEEAEKVKRQVGLDESKEHQSVRSALLPIVDSLIAEIINSLKFHDEHSDSKISQIILCGGTSKLMFLTSYMYQKLAADPEYSKIDILLGDPWINVFDPKSKVVVPLTKDESLDYTTAIGLAMRGARKGDA